VYGRGDVAVCCADDLTDADPVSHGHDRPRPAPRMLLQEYGKHWRLRQAFYRTVRRLFFVPRQSEAAGEAGLSGRDVLPAQRALEREWRT